MSSAATGRLERLVTSKRWLAFMASLVALVLLALTGAPPEVVAPLAEGVGWGLVALLGVESAADGFERMARARRERQSAIPIDPPIDEGQNY